MGERPRPCLLVWDNQAMEPQTHTAGRIQLFKTKGESNLGEGPKVLIEQRFGTQQTKPRTGNVEYPRFYRTHDLGEKGNEDLCYFRDEQDVSPVLMIVLGCSLGFDLSMNWKVRTGENVGMMQDKGHVTWLHEPFRGKCGVLEIATLLLTELHTVLPRLL